MSPDDDTPGTDAPPQATSLPMHQRLGVDVGGTFTDAACHDGRRLHVRKLPSTPPDFQDGVLTACEYFARRGTLELIHGSTVATNALLQRGSGGPGGAGVALVTTAGFRDVLEIARQDRPDVYALHVVKPEPVIDRRHCHEVPGRFTPSGEEAEPFDDDAAAAVCEAVRGKGLTGLAVSLLFSFVDDAHERRMGEIARGYGLDVTLSSRVLPRIGEYERATATAIAATLRPPVKRYLDLVRRGLPEQVTGVRVLHGGGGSCTLEDAPDHAARLVLSGPAGGVAGAAVFARRHGAGDAVTLDMGGTSTDVALLRDGTCATTDARVVDGLPLALEMLDIHTVGAGGGSVAYVDAGGALRVGPRSAGALPGPACYHKGGALATVTDADVVLGRLPGDVKLGGSMPLVPELAMKVLTDLARKIGGSAQDAAAGVARVVEANMAAAVRDVTSRRGIDPRPLTLVSFGGAGGLHALPVAEAVGMRRVLVPPRCGVLSAIGMLAAPRQADASRTVLHLAAELDDDRLHAEFGRLSAETADEVPLADTAAVSAAADVRFRGRTHALRVAVTTPTVSAVVETFTAAYRARYGDPPNEPAEIVTLHLRRLGHTPDLDVPPPTGDPHIDDERCNREHVRAAGPLAGPRVVLDEDATLWVPPGWTVACADDGSLICERGGA